MKERRKSAETEDEDEEAEEEEKSGNDPDINVTRIQHRREVRPVPECAAELLEAQKPRNNPSHFFKIPFISDRSLLNHPRLFVCTRGRSAVEAADRRAGRCSRCEAWPR